MVSRAERLATALERIQRLRAESALAWSKHGHSDADWVFEAQRLLSDQGTAESHDALRERTWSRAEQQAFVRQRAAIAFALELAPGAPQLAQFSRDVFALPFGSEQLAPLVRGLWSDGSAEGRNHRAHALAQAAEALAPRLFELRGRARHAFEHHSRTLQLPAAEVDLLLAPARADLPPRARAHEVEPAPELAPDALAREFLESTEDPTRELVRWLVKPAAVSGTIAWHLLLRGLRAPELDGLARPARRWARVAEGLRNLGFERDLSSRVRAEPGVMLFDPRARVLALAIPSNVRVAQSALDFGLLSDLYAAQGVAQALAHVLVSPALPVLVARPSEPGLAEAFGVLFMQLRADREYLRRVDGLDQGWVERVARQAGVLMLLEARVQAALYLAELAPARTDVDRLQQLTAAMEGALGVELPPGLAALAGWSAPLGPAAFEASVAGLAAHVGLRERYDADWYRNPRVSELLRGAAARGSTLTLPEFLLELSVPAGASAARAIELLG